MLKLRTKLGITAGDLLPASVALELEGDVSPSPTRQEDGGTIGDAEPAGILTAARNSDRFRAAARAIAPDVGRWKKEVDDMLGLLGTDAEKCAHDYPMAELKRKVLPEIEETIRPLP